MKKNKIKYILIFFFIFITFSSFIANISGQETEEVNNNLFSPMYVDDVEYKIYNEQSELLATVGQAYDDLTVWRDPNHEYPVIDIIKSEPFIVDESGIINLDDERVMLDPSTLEFATNGSDLMYLKKFYFAVDLCVRTYSNLPSIKYYDIPISPLDNLYHSHDGGERNDTFGDAEGLILAKMDTGTAPWEKHEYLSNVVVQNSLYLMDLTPTTLRDTEPNSLSDAINSLSSEYGNKKVIVRPTITLNAIDDLIKYDYERHYPDGSKIKIKTTNAEMGFFKVHKVSQLDKHGIIPNKLDEDLNELDDEIFIPQDKLDEVTPDKPKSPDKESYISVRNYEAHFKYLTSTPTYHGGSSRIYESIQSNIVPQQINLNAFNLPNSASVTPEFELEPLTTIDWASYHLKYLAWFQDAAGLLNIHREDEIISGTKTITYPWKLRIDNFYAKTRIVYQVAVLTHNEMTVIPTDGDPISVDDFSDYDLNELGVLPNYNDVDATVESRSFNWAKFWSDFFSFGGFFTWIMIGVVAIIVIVIMSKVIPKRAQKQVIKIEK